MFCISFLREVKAMDYGFTTTCPAVDVAAVRCRECKAYKRMFPSVSRRGVTFHYVVELPTRLVIHVSSVIPLWFAKLGRPGVLLSSLSNLAHSIIYSLSVWTNFDDFDPSGRLP